MSATSDDTQGRATPQWSSGFKATNYTGLEAHSAVYDAATNELIVFAGLSAGLAFNDTNAVILNSSANAGGGWSVLIADGAAGSPPARDAHTAVYDSANNRMIIFGGEQFALGTDLNDVWVLSNANGQGGTATWTQLSPSGTPPAARSLHSAVYDAATNTMIVFGGVTSNNVTFQEVWTLSNANGLGGTPAWKKLAPSGTAPVGVYGVGTVYDAANNIMTVFAGINGGTTAAANGVWTLSHANGTGGTPHWTNIVANGAPGSPTKRETPAAIYDAVNNRMTIFGGASFPTIGAFNDVWVLSSANGLGGTAAWTRLKPTGTAPGTRFFHSAAYDAANNVMIVYGGNNDEAVYFVTWTLSDANGL